MLLKHGCLLLYHDKVMPHLLDFVSQEAAIPPCASQQPQTPS